MKIRFAGVAILIAACSIVGWGKKTTDHAQIICDDVMLSDLGAYEIVDGPYYAVFQEVATAFELAQLPHLYLHNNPNPEFDSAFYVIGSLAFDGKGKILISENFLRQVGYGLPLRGVIAHEMAHLVVDTVKGGHCRPAAERHPIDELAADKLAVSKVGFTAVEAALFKVEQMTDFPGEVRWRLRSIAGGEYRKYFQRRRSAVQ
jgi:hypothetical protein